MKDAIPQLTLEQQQELEAIKNNTQLLEFMEAYLPNQGEVESDEKILERQAQAIEAFSQNSPDFWSLE